MSTITKERVAEFIKNPLDNGLTRGEQMVLARIALASLEAAPVAWDHEWASCITCDGPQNFERIIEHEAPPEWAIKSGQARNLIPLYTAPPAPVSVPDALADGIDSDDHPLLWSYNNGWNACRAAMLQGADTELQRKAAIHDALCEKYNVESLTDFVDWQSNHIAELEAAPPAPVGEGETVVMPDYPGYVMTQRECFDAGAKRAVPDGWVAVPIEPTYQMCEAMGLSWECPRFPDCYKAMIAAINISKK